MNKLVQSTQIMLLLLLSYTQQSIAQSTSWTGTVSTSWSNSANWTNGVPDSTKDAFIGDGYYSGTYEPRITTRGTCKSLTIGGVYPITFTQAMVLRVFENVHIESNGTLTHGSPALYVAGNWINNGTYNPTSANSQVVFSGTLQTVGGTSTTNFIKLNVARNSTIILANDITSIGAGSSVLVSGTINPGMSPSYQISATGRMQVYDGGKVKVNKELFSDNYDISGGLVLYGGSIIDYSSTVVNQTISSSYSYSTLMISGTGTKSLTANLPALNSRGINNGTIEVVSGTFDMAGYTANRGSFMTGGEISVANGATLKLSGNSNFPRNFQRRSLEASSLVEYYGGNQNISDQTYGNLLISGTGSKAVTLSFSVQEDFTIQSSTVSCGSNAATITVGGNLVQTGGSISGTAEIFKMNGTASQSINLISSIPYLTMENTGTGVTLASDVNVTKGITFTDGLVTTGTNVLALASGGTVTGASASTGWVYGNLKKSVTASGTTEFAVGTSTQYTPATIVISALTAAGNITATSIVNDHPEIDYSGINPNKSVNLYWDFTNEGVTFGTANITFGWTASCMDAGSDASSFLAASYDGTNWRLENVNSRAASTINIDGVSSLNQFSVGDEVDQHYWTGSGFSNDWFTAKNWYGGVPGSSTSVTIPNPLTPRRYYPVITSGQIAQVKDMVIESDAEVVLSDGTIEIYGNATSTGVFDATAGTVDFKGASPQTINSGFFYQNKVRDLVISNDVTLADADSVTGTLTIADGKTFHTNENLVLKSDANGTARLTELPVDGSGNATAYIDGTVSIERYIPARKAWRLLSVPVKASSAPTIVGSWQEGAYGNSLAPNPTPHYGVHITGGPQLNGFDQSNTNLSSVKVYNPTTHMFEGLAATPGTLRPITDYSGYMVYIRGDRSIDIMQGLNAAVTSTTLRIKGEVLTGKQTSSVNATGFTVLGNPYPSPINFATLTRSNVRNFFYIWDPKLAGSNGLGAYVTVSYNSGTGTYDVTTAASPISQYIPSGEAILIQSEDGSSAGSITINESDKSSEGSDMLFGRNNTVSKSIRVNLQGQDQDGSYSLIDGALTNYHQNNNSALDRNDIDKLFAGSESISLKRGGKFLSIERRQMIGFSDTSFIALGNLSTKNYRLEIGAENMTEEGLTAFVVDKYKGATYQLPMNVNGNSYIDFTVNGDAASSSSDRFYIVFSSRKTTVIKQQETVKSEKSSSKASEVEKIASVEVNPNPSNDNNINFTMNNLPSGSYKVSIYNMNGQVVYSTEVKHIEGQNTHQAKLNTSMATGRYEMKIEGQGRMINTSLIMQ